MLHAIYTANQEALDLVLQQLHATYGEQIVFHLYSGYCNEHGIPNRGVRAGLLSAAGRAGSGPRSEMTKVRGRHGRYGPWPSERAQTASARRAASSSAISASMT